MGDSLFFWFCKIPVHHQPYVRNGRIESYSPQHDLFFYTSSRWQTTERKTRKRRLANHIL